MAVAVGEKKGLLYDATVALMQNSHFIYYYTPHHTMVIAKHVSYLIWIVWYPAGPEKICIMS